MIELLMTDKKLNPSNYALVIVSEGAEWEGYQVREYGEADAFGHLGHGSDLRVLLLVLGDEQDALFVADVDRQGDGHAGEDNGVL